MFLTHAASSILKTNLGIKRHERILIFTDYTEGKPSVERQGIKEFCLILRDFAQSFSKEAIFYEYPETGMHGTEPPEDLWRIAFGDIVVKELKKARLFRRLLNKTLSMEQLNLVSKIVKRYSKRAVHAVIALSKYSTSHTNFRDLLTGICGTRYASMPLFEISMLEGSMNVDWKTVKRRTTKIASRLRMADTVIITTPNGTELVFSKKGRVVYKDTGILTKPGAFGNLPAGEVFVAPVEGTAEGRLVIEWAPTRRLLSPLELIVEQGYVKEIKGDEPFKEVLLKKFEESPLNANIAEFGIGTNDRATRPENILEAEKILGTIHIALGDNSSFGGTVRTPMHQDFVFFKPTVVIKKGQRQEKLISDGKILN